MHMNLSERRDRIENKYVNFILDFVPVPIREPIQQKTVKKKLCRWSICRTVLPKRTVLPIRTVLTGGTVLPTL